MKRKYLVFAASAILTLIFFSSGCRKDLGNYDYETLNEVNIANLLPSYSPLQGTVLKINPELTFSLDKSGDTSLYTYKWFAVIKAGGFGASETTFLMSTTKNLNWLATLASARYTGFYEVTEKSTGIKYSKTFELNVMTNVNNGWLILNDINGESRLDYINFNSIDEPQTFKDVLASQNSVKLTGKPKLVYFCNRIDVFTRASGKAVFVGTDEATYILRNDQNTFTNFTNFASSGVLTKTLPYYAEKIRNPIPNRLYVLDNKGDMTMEYPAEQTFFGDAINIDLSGAAFRISPYFSASNSYVLMYDIDKKRFMQHSGSSSTLPTVPIYVGTTRFFNPGSVDMDLVYMDYTKYLSGQTYAVFKNNANKFFLTTIISNSSTFQPQLYQEITNVPEIANAIYFAIDPTNGYLMYATDSKVYRYNPTDKSSSLVIDLGARKISLLKYQSFLNNNTPVANIDKYRALEQSLIVCSYEEASPAFSGIMTLYTVPALNGSLSMSKTFKDFGKIVDLSFRE